MSWQVLLTANSPATPVTLVDTGAVPVNLGHSLICLWEKRCRCIGAALQDAARDTMIPEIREASWTAPALWRFARRRGIREISA